MKKLLTPIVLMCFFLRAHGFETKDIEGKWCTKENSAVTLGAYDTGTNPTHTKSLCIEYKIDKSDDQGGIGRYLRSRERSDGQRYPIKRHPLEKDDKNSSYVTNSPGIFGFAMSNNNHTMIIKDQSLSRSLITASGLMTSPKEINFIINYRPKENQVGYASVSYLKLEKVSDELDDDFMERWKNSLENLKTTLAKKRSTK